ncbi:10791_t:CDS:2 [Funneliformis geosporum]|nr:10791_t:CDS:2 [Funneliformis geosporum]
MNYYWNISREYEMIGAMIYKVKNQFSNLLLASMFMQNIKKSDEITII